MVEQKFEVSFQFEKALTHGQALAFASKINIAVNNFDQMVSTIKACATRFREYEQSHLEKGTVDGDMKARRNAQMAEMCEEVLKNV